jgi:hypothetical protein
LSPHQHTVAWSANSATNRRINFRLGETGTLWRSRRISWDGIWDLREVDGRLHGKCWDAVTDCEASFSIDILTGELVGGVYPEPPDLQP